MMMWKQSVTHTTCGLRMMHVIAAIMAAALGFLAPGEVPPQNGVKPPMTSPPPAATQPAATEPAVRPELPEVDPKWLDRMPRDDRAAIDEWLGYAPPNFSDDLKWLETASTDWNTLRGRVVVVQSWSTGSTSLRNWPARVAATLKQVETKDLCIIALHTPDNADNAESYMLRQKPPGGVTVVIDPVGNFCDELGVYKHPVNFVIDRNGMVRYAGLNMDGLEKAVAELVQQTFDRKKVPAFRSAVKAQTPDSTPQYPSIASTVRGANDLRGKRAPEFVADSWITRQPNPAGKVVVINFWSINSTASLAAHPSLNALAARFGDSVCIVALAEDSRSNFDDEMILKRINKSDFNYAVALDRNRTMANAMGVSAIPHCVVISRDWIVRWQGQPNELRPETLDEIIKADAASASSNTKQTRPGKRRGWASDAKPQ